MKLIPTAAASSCEIWDAKDSPRVLEKYKVRQEVTLDESVEEHSDSS